MWSLPNIKALNDNAVAVYEKNKKKTAKQILRGQKCDHCDKKADVFYEYYDVFSDVPKGYIFLCEEHDRYYGSPDEGYFECDDCGRVFILNYTWEIYNVLTESEILCLNCYFDREIDDPGNWIERVEDVTLERIRESKHLIPVAGEYWEKHLDFHGNVEFDSTTGERLYGSAQDGVEDAKGIVEKALETHDKCILILDAGYQFAVSIGVYTRKEKEKGGKQ